MVLLEDVTTNKVHRYEREHVLVRSASGRRLIVLEVLENETGIEAYEVSGYLTAAAAERRLEELAGCWLSEASRAEMNDGRCLKVGELRWTSP